MRCPQSIQLRLRAPGRKPLEFFYQPVKFDCPITAESWAAIYLSAKYSVYAGWEEQPQPAPPGCGLSTSSTSLKPRSIAGLTSLKEYAIITILS